MTSGWRAAAYLAALWIGLMSGLRSIMREIIAFVAPERVAGASLFYACARIAAIICFVTLWRHARSEQKAESKLLRGELEFVRQQVRDLAKRLEDDGPVVIF